MQKIKSKLKLKNFDGGGGFGGLIQPKSGRGGQYASKFWNPSILRRDEATDINATLIFTIEHLNLVVILVPFFLS